MTTLTYPLALTLTQQIVAEYGEDYIYRPALNGGGEGTCSYVSYDGTAPGCIMGHIFHRVGVTLAQLRQLDLFDDPTIGTLHEDEDLPPGVKLDENGVYFLSILQDEQDGGSTWGDALARAQAQTERNN